MTYFAERTSWDLTSNELTEILNKLKQSGQAVYDLTVSNPTQCGFHYPNNFLLKELCQDANMIYEADPHGILSARHAVVEYYRIRGVVIDPANVFLTASTSEAYGFLFRLLADPGGQVLFPKPSYPLFEFLAGINDLQWQTYNLIYDQDWRLHKEGLSDVLKDHVRAMILVNPNNPTGSCLNEGELSCINATCRSMEVPIICDEVFLDYPFDEACTIKTLAGNDENLTFVLGGLSKSLILPQMKLSWIIVSGPNKERNEAVKRLEMIADTYLSVNAPVQHALPQWMTVMEDLQGQVLKRIRLNRKFLLEKVSAPSEKVEVLNADGGWSAVIKVFNIDDDEVFVKNLLLEEQVFIHPGYFFDFEEDGFFVISLLLQEDVFQEGIGRLLNKC